MRNQGLSVAAMHAGAAAVQAAAEMPRASDNAGASTEEAPGAEASGAELVVQQSAPMPTKEVKAESAGKKEPQRCVQLLMPGVCFLQRQSSAGFWAATCVGCGSVAGRRRKTRK